MASVRRTYPCAFLATLLAMASISEATPGFLARMNRNVVAQELLTEITALLGHGTKHKRLVHLEDVMRPMYMSLPRQKDGGIAPGVARYALNRYFSAHRGWYLTGIAQSGERWNESSSTTEMLKSKMPSFLIENLEEHIAHKRLGLEELAVLAATVEDLVYSDTLELLTMAYGAYNLSMNEELTEREAKRVINTFMLFHLNPWTWPSWNNSKALAAHLRTAHKDNPAWTETMLWVEDLKGAIKYQDRVEHNPFLSREVYFGSYPSMVHLVEQVIDGYGLFQDLQCRELKNAMMDLETQERNDGRVLLANFYRPYMQGTHQFFVERPEYLKALGSLDDSDPKQPSVIVPNYLYGRSFCVGTENGFQSFCCVDQCNVLMETLERSIAHPVASPSLIAELVAALPTETVAAPRNLSISLRHKLDKIAEANGGHVPLHGRLFSQWLHHAFPNECPQPRAPGVTEAPMTHDEWQASRNITPTVPKEVIRNLTDAAAEMKGAMGQDETCMLWTDEEELVTSIELQALGSPSSLWLDVVRFMAMCTAVASLIAILVNAVSSSCSLLLPEDSKKASPRASDLSSRMHAI
mmetsp:Transcript_83989/g.211781  ORF Transcript_83989/g.211781 Transcript_83989/m.211781 type:complete len:581 (-) Transcript_83989:169-1911(-)